MIELFHNDCLEQLKSIPDNSAQLFLTDLPYGSTYCPWDTVVPFEPLWAEVERILTPNGTFITTASQPFTSLLVASNIKMFKYSMVWEKTRRTGFQLAWQRPLKAHEDILVFSKGTTIHPSHSPNVMVYNPQGLVELPEPLFSRNGGMGRHMKDCYSEDGKVKKENWYRHKPQTHSNFPCSVLKFTSFTKKRDKDSHPTQKPVELYDYLVRTFSNVGDTVIDPCMGSGTTGIACKMNDRNFIGIEMDETYFEMAKDRLK